MYDCFLMSVFRLTFYLYYSSESYSIEEIKGVFLHLVKENITAKCSKFKIFRKTCVSE